MWWAGSNLLCALTAGGGPVQITSIFAQCVVAVRFSNAGPMTTAWAKIHWSEHLTSWARSLHLALPGKHPAGDFLMVNPSSRLGIPESLQLALPFGLNGFTSNLSKINKGQWPDQNFAQPSNLGRGSSENDSSKMFKIYIQNFFAPLTTDECQVEPLSKWNLVAPRKGFVVW